MWKIKSSGKNLGSILVLGNYRQTLTVIRSLAHEGYSVIIGQEEENRSMVEHSRHISSFWPHPNIINQEKIFITQLKDFLRKKADVIAVFPVHEREISCLLRYYDSIKDLTNIVMPEPRILMICLSKKKTYEVALATGVPLPSTEIATDLSDIRRAASLVGFPFVVKPDSPLRPFPGKAVIIRSAEEIEQVLPEWPKGNDFLIVQSYSIGFRHNCYFKAVHGDLVAYYEHKIVRTDNPDNTGLGVENITIRPTPELFKYTSALLREMDYTGIGCAQYIIDPDTRSVILLELNPRLGANCAAPYRFGVDLPLFAVECATNPISQKLGKPLDYPEGMLSYWMSRDIEVLYSDILEGNIKRGSIWKRAVQIVRCTLSADCHITWSWSDPLPTTLFMSNKVYRFLRRISRYLRNQLPR